MLNDHVKQVESWMIFVIKEIYKKAYKLWR